MSANPLVTVLLVVLIFVALTLIVVLLRVAQFVVEAARRAHAQADLAGAIRRCLPDSFGGRQFATEVVEALRRTNRTP